MRLQPLESVAYWNGYVIAQPATENTQLTAALTHAKSAEPNLRENQKEPPKRLEPNFFLKQG